MSKANNKNVSDSDTNIHAAETTGAITETATENKPPNDGGTSFVYIGAALPDGRLKSNTVLVGAYAEITEYYKDVIKDYPAVAKLIVPVAQLAQSRDRAQKSGNILNRYNQEIVAAIKARGEKE